MIWGESERDISDEFVIDHIEIGVVVVVVVESKREFRAGGCMWKTSLGCLAQGYMYTK